MHVRGFLFSFIWLWSCGCHLLALRYMRALGGQIPAQMSVLRELLFLVTSQLTSQQDDATWAFLVPLPTRILKENLCTLALLNSCTSCEEEEDHHENTPWAKQARERPGPHCICWSFPTGNQAKLCFTKAKAAKAGLHLSSCSRLQCTSRAGTAWPGPLTAPNQPQVPPAASAWAKMFHFPSTPPLPWSQNKAKQKTPCREGWTDWWFGLFCVFAFKWEGITGGGGREKKQYWGGLVIFGAHLLEKWISLWIQKLGARSQEDICPMLHNQWTSFSYAISTSASKNRA